MFTRKKTIKKSTSSIIPHPELGEVTVLRSVRARRITISIRPPGRIRLTVPSNIPLDHGMRFLEAKKEWICNTLRKQSEKYSAPLILPPYKTRLHTLILQAEVGGKISVRIKDGIVQINHPAELAPEHQQIQEAIRQGILQAWRAEAKEYLPGRTRELAHRHGFSFGKVSVRNSRSKWGSCSAADNISYSLHLMRLPDHLIDYIILHELCHTVHKNHGAAFHELLNRVCDGRHPALRKELRGYTTYL